MKKLFLASVFSPFVFFSAHAGGTDMHRVLAWKVPVENAVSETEKVRQLFFDKAAYNGEGLPVYYEKIALTSGTAATVSIENAVYEPLKEIDLIPSKAKLNAEPQVTAETGIRKKKYFACVTILPFRKSVTGIDRLVSFDLKVVPSNGGTSNGNGSGNQSQRFYSHNSILNSGTWYKIGVT